MIPPLSYDSSQEMASAKAHLLAVQTNTRVLGSFTLLALLLGSTAALSTAVRSSAQNEVISGAVRTTHDYRANQIDQYEEFLIRELTRVFGDLASRQVEMDRVAKRVLYSRMRELLRR